MKRIVRKLYEPRRAAIMAIALGLLFTVARLVTPMIGEPTPGVILVVGEFNHSDSPANQILAGMKARISHLGPTLRGLEVKPVREDSILRQGNLDPGRDIEDLVINAMASEAVVAVVIASTSRTAPAVLRTSSTLNRPAIIATASQDELLNKSYSETSAVRLTPNNTAEGQMLGREILARLSTGKAKHVAILADSSPYASQINDAIFRELQQSPLIHQVTFPSVGHIPSVSTINETASKADWIICLGYDEIIKQVFRTVASAPNSKREQPEVTFSDSAIPFRDMLSRMRKVSIVYPKYNNTGNGQPEHSETLGQNIKAAFYTIAGQDIVTLIMKARENAGWQANMKLAFVAFWKHPDRKLELQPFQFDQTGQAMNTKWSLLDKADFETHGN